MISVPILLREFRVAARKKRTFVVRGVFGGLLTIATLLFLLVHIMASQSSAVGLYLLKTLGWQILLTLFVIAPALSCGSISEERKQGTLGLLFLTHLNSADIILGKFVSRGLDLLLLFLSALPFLFVPILMGGVGWAEMMTIVWSMVSLLVLSLSLGVFCSTFCRTTVQAVIVTYLTLTIYNIVLIVLPQVGMITAAMGRGSWAYPQWLRMATPAAGLLYGGVLNALISLACSVALAVVFLGLSMWRLPGTLYADSAGRVTRARSWLRFEPSNRKSRSPARVPDSNPVFWLDYSRRGRWMVQLVLTAVLVCAIAWIYAMADTEIGQAVVSMSMAGFGWVLGFFLKILILLFVARSFAVEKEDGSLELLLITPLQNRAIVKGKMLAVLARFGLLYAVACALQFSTHFGSEPWQQLLRVFTDASGLAYLLGVGMWISVWARSPTQAILYAILATMVVGWILGMASAVCMMILMGLLAVWSGGTGSQMFAYSELMTIGPVVLRLIVDVLLALLAYRLLVANLRVYAAR